MFPRILFLGLLLTVGVSGLRAQEERFGRLQIGSVTYTNVTVLNKTGSDIYIRHRDGACNIKLHELDPELLAELGYLVDERAFGRRRGVDFKPVEVDPRVQAMQAELAAEMEDYIKTVAPKLFLIVGGVCLVFYLFFCYCCKLICQKAGAPSAVLIWIPILQIFPLFRAAKMSGWAVLGMFAPQIFSVVASFALPKDLSPTSLGALLFLGLAFVAIFLPTIITIVWCVKICKARGKNGWLALFLILPISNIFAFLYLAFSGDDEEEETLGNPGFVTFS